MLIRLKSYLINEIFYQIWC